MDIWVTRYGLYSVSSDDSSDSNSSTETMKKKKKRKKEKRLRRKKEEKNNPRNARSEVKRRVELISREKAVFTACAPPGYNPYYASNPISSFDHQYTAPPYYPPAPLIYPQAPYYPHAPPSYAHQYDHSHHQQQHVINSDNHDKDLISGFHATLASNNSIVSQNTNAFIASCCLNFCSLSFWRQIHSDL